MSHQPERREKNCLNCGSIVMGRYCHVCGQENIVTKETFWSLCKHFVYDIFHFDGNFFATLKYLFIRPGFVAREYTGGKRVKYLHPIRMYLFTSAVFFLIFINFSNQTFTKTLKVGSDTLNYESRKDIAGSLQERLKNNPGNTVLRQQIAVLLDTTRTVTANEINKGSFLGDDEARYRSLDSYDSVQKTLSPKQRDGWLKRQFVRKGITLNEKFKENKQETLREFSEAFLHKAPYMLFLSLPFFALILKLLYVRRKNLYYSDHAVFTLYHYIFSFITLLCVLAVSGVQHLSGWRPLNNLIILLFIAWFVYSYLEMRGFYRQGYLKTFLKFVLLNFLAFVVIFILFIGFLLIAFLQI